MISINFDEICQKYSEDSRTEFACFSYHNEFALYHRFVPLNQK